MPAETAYGRARAPPSGGPERRGLVDRAWALQHRIEHRAKRIGSGRYARVMKMARKPEPEEFRQAATIVAIGLAVIGLLGFTMSLLFGLLWRVLGIR